MGPPFLKRPERMRTDGTSHVSPEKSEEERIIKDEEVLGREWFAITAFPLFAGTFGPIASALNICALVQPWRCEYASTASQNDAKDIPDPSWLIATNAISLFFGVVANLSIMFVGGFHKGPHPARHGFYLVLVTIIGGGLASFILIALVIVDSTRIRLASPPEHAFTEAYYYAIMAASLYFITSGFIVYTAHMLWKTLKTREGRRELSKQFASQHRSLKMLTILFLAYLLLGAAVFARIEGWRYLDSVFWADVTILTIGFGDFKPATHLGKSLLIPYALFGIFILFLVIYCITQVVFERGKSMWEVRIRNQERLRRIREREGNGPRRHGIFKSHPHGSSSSDVNVNPTENPSHIGTTVDHKKLRKQRLAEERAARERDFLTMRSILLKSTRQRILYSMELWLFFSLFLWFFGALLFYFCERGQDWSYFNSMYFTFISILAIGYGDKTLESKSGRAVFVLWSLIVVPTLTMLITTGTEAIGVPYLVGMQEWFLTRVLRREQPSGSKVEKKISHTYKSPITKFPPQLGHNNHDKNHLLIRAIKSIARDHIQHQESKSQPDYTFKDWEYMFYLMDILESEDESNSRPTSSKPHKEGSANGGRQEKRNEGERRTAMEKWQDGSKIPDWLHGKNPLNVTESMTEWMLLALMEKLESQLADLRRREGNTMIE